MRFLSRLCVLLSIFVCPLAWADYEQPVFNMHRGVTSLSHDMYLIHMVTLLICVVIGIIVFGAMIYAFIFHRKSRGAVAAEFHEHPTLEFVWAIIPFFILVVMAIPATIVLLRINNFSNSELTIKVTGYQWKWQYQYLNQGITFFSTLATPLTEINNKVPKDRWYLLEVDNPLVVPVHKKIRFLITSNDVIHSWWVPALGVKKDAVPGFIHEAWAVIDRPGTYRGQCAELCGMGHGFMPIVVIAKTETDFNKWVSDQQQKQQAILSQSNQTLTLDQLMKLGQAAYNKNCSACHQQNGQGLPPVYPALKGSSVVVGKPVSRHIDIVLNGVPGTAMQAFANQLTDLEIASIITYERNSWGNNTGDIVQPADVKAERVKPTGQVQPTKK